MPKLLYRYCLATVQLQVKIKILDVFLVHCAISIFRTNTAVAYNKDTVLKLKILRVKDFLSV